MPLPGGIPIGGIGGAPGGGEIPIDPRIVLAMPNFIVFAIDDTSHYEFKLYADDPGNNQADLYWIENLVAPRSVRFTRAYAKPNCSPWRAAFLTGRYGFHTGVGDLAQFGLKPLSLSETTIAKVLSQKGYATALIGKLHLSSPANQGELYPVLAGFDFWQGTMANLPARGEEDFNHWRRWTTERTRQGIQSRVERIDRYLTIQQVEDALAWIERQDRPFFLHFCFNDPHSPYNRPPAELYDATTYDLEFDRPQFAFTAAQKNPYFKAKLQSVDWAIGQILNGIPQAVLANTHVIVVADNGTPADVTIAPFVANHAKNSVYEQGLRVPLYWMGPSVSQPNREFDAVFKVEDFFPTIAALAGVDLATEWPLLSIDGMSHAVALQNAAVSQINSFIYTEGFSPNGPNLNAATPGERAVIGVPYKLIRNTTGIAFPHATDEMYDVVADPLELTNLIPGGATGGLTAPELAAYNLLADHFVNTVTV